ncbi:MAG: alpha/beta hydrolase [Deltaproteobacteria bacterium]
MLPLQKAELEVCLSTSYVYEPSRKTKQGILVLHGFSDHAQSVKKRLLGSDPISDFHVFAPNGLFPSPTKRENEFKEGYAWYFRDPASGKQMISPEFAADALVKLIGQVGLAHLEWTVLGFSQGGFFAPFLVKAGLSCQKIIGVGAAYRVEAYEGLSHLQVFGVHGEKDTIVPFDYAQSSFELLKQRGFGKSFYAIPELGHTLNEAGRKIIREILNSK